MCAASDSTESHMTLKQEMHSSYDMSSIVDKMQNFKIQD